MSYILDALKKSDQQRQRGMTPTLHTAQTTVIALRQPAYLFYAVFATILICAGVIIGWLQPWHTEPAFPVISPVPAQPVMPHAQSIKPLPQPVLPDTLSPPAAEQPPLQPLPANPVAPEQSHPAPQHEIPAPARPKTVVTHPKTVTAPAPKKTTPSDTLPAQRGILSITELPATVQQEIPKISISGILFTNDPEGRLVGINNKLMREGEYLAPDLKLEQITPDGVVFSYKQYRFRP